MNRPRGGISCHPRRRADVSSGVPPRTTPKPPTQVGALRFRTRPTDWAPATEACRRPRSRDRAQPLSPSARGRGGRRNARRKVEDHHDREDGEESSGPCPARDGGVPFPAEHIPDGVGSHQEQRDAYAKGEQRPPRQERTDAIGRCSHAAIVACPPCGMTCFLTALQQGLANDSDPIRRRSIGGGVDLACEVVNPYRPLFVSDVVPE